MPKKQVSKTYLPGENEKKIYSLWEKSGFFNPDKIKSKKRYCNILPPPNANGELHLGHASGYTVMDIFGRFERMRGKKVLLLPGKDHAGIQSQTVYEKKIKEERGIDRHALGREKFFREMTVFCRERSGYMRGQEKRIGISADWSREKFTLDEKVLAPAMETFFRMFRDGLVYEGERIVNWCPRCETALSDVEVVRKEIDGKLYHIKYPLKDSNEFIVVATTRPETMLGDTAVAVHPSDERYQKMVGKKVLLPLQGREIPIIFDRRIEKDFGTGAVKITPAHDPLDWKIGRDHKLEIISVISDDGQIRKEGGKYFNQKTKEARENILKDLKELGLLEKIEETKINISVCERCKTAIEPLVSKQWFINVDAKKYSIKKETLKAVRKGRINFYPETFRKAMISWLENLEDWCISRQIWWGPRFPVWKKEKPKTKQQAGNSLEKKEEEKDFEIYVGSNAPKGKGWKRDENTFDTWFTSGQWPYTTLDYPKGKDGKIFYPTDMMVMGRDILFFWAARMIMLGLYRTKKVPFENLYFTGLIRDREGQKMSKSKGNGIDPLEMIERYGADALRLSLVTETTPGLDLRLYEEKIEGFRNFITKIWNIYRYCLSFGTEFSLRSKIAKKDIRSLGDFWIVSRLNKTILEATRLLENKKISLSQEKIRKFIWDDFADWYVEISKSEKNTAVLGYVLDKILKLSHPFTPFVTEKIFQDLSGKKSGKLLMMESWPKADKKMISSKAEKEFGETVEAVSKIRNLRSSYKIDPAKKIKAVGEKIKNKEILEKMARIEIESRPLEKSVRRGLIRICAGKTILDLELSGIIDVSKEISSLEKEIQNLESLFIKTQGLLANRKFLESAPEEVVEANRLKLAEYGEKIENRKKLLDDLRRMEN